MIRSIKIEAVLNGFIVYIGCQTLVFDSAAVLADELERYLKNPMEVEKEYLNKSVNAKHTTPEAISLVPEDNPRPTLRNDYPSTESATGIERRQ